MIDFRYHLVSIVAVFVALSVGLVLGTTKLNGAVLDNLNGRVDGLRKDKQELRTELRQTQDQVANAERVLKLQLPALVAGRLDGQRVAVLSAPGTPDGLRTDAMTAVQAAGASVTVSVRISTGYVDPSKDLTLRNVVSRLATTGGAPASGNGARRAAEVLAAALLARPGEGNGSAPDAERVLTAFQRAGLVKVDGNIRTPGAATLALLLTGPGDRTRSDAAQKAADIILTLASALDGHGSGTVIGGPFDATVNEGPLMAARAAQDLSREVSTVDSVDSPVGQVETVFALAAELRGESVAWGAGPGTTMPALSPS